MEVPLATLSNDNLSKDDIFEKNEELKSAFVDKENHELTSNKLPSRAPSEDSGVSSNAGSICSEPVSSAETKIQFEDNVEFVSDPHLLFKDIHADRELEREKNRQLKKEELEQKRLEREAYEAEIQEQQYKRLMVLLNKSKGFAHYFLNKTDASKNENSKVSPNKKTSRKRTANKKYLDDESVSAPKKSKRGRKKKGELNLSSDEIQEELAALSDNENDEAINDINNFVNLKYFTGGELRDYQKIGFNWLKMLYENGMNGILADEMGLGKTIQVIALISYLIEKKIGGPYMIVVPLSTLPNWASEFERFAPKIPVVVYYGSKEEREEIKGNVLKHFPVSETFKTRPVVLVTYQNVMNDQHFLKTFVWRYIVIDEAQRIKNMNTHLKRIMDTFRSNNKLLLTGTPLQNNLSELFSLLNFLLPDIFNDLRVFESWFDAKEVQSEMGKKKFFKQEQEKKIIQTLRAILHPFMLRRIKEDVCPEIPPMKEVIVYAPLTALQYDLYQGVIKRDIDTLYKTETAPVIVDIDGKRPKRKCTKRVNLDEAYEICLQTEKYKVNNADDEELKLFNSEGPGIVKVKNSDVKLWKKYTDVSQENIQYFIRLTFGRPLQMYMHIVNHPYLLHYPLNDCGLPKVTEEIVKKSGKLIVLDAMLKKLKENNHKILFFSGSKMFLDIFEDYLTLRPSYEYVRLDGETKIEDRKDNIASFNQDPNIFLFLMTTRAGSVGLNLAAADTVIIYDSDWNPQSDLQAMARCHRIGQVKPVVVYRLCTKGTIDEEVIKRAQAKRFLEKCVISKETESVFYSKDGVQKLQKLLEKNEFTMYNAKKDVYTEEELDEILDRSDLIEQQKQKLIRLGHLKEDNAEE